MLSFKSVLLISLLMCSYIAFSSINKKGELEPKSDFPLSNNLDPNSFLFLKKNMTLNQVMDYLSSHNLNHSPITNVDKNTDYTSYFIYDKTKYILVFNYPVGDMVLDTVKISFIENYVISAEWVKIHTHIYYVNMSEQQNEQRKEKDRLFYAKNSRIFYKLIDGLESKYGKPKKGSLHNVNGYDIVIPKIIPNNRNPNLPPGKNIILYSVSWGADSDCTILAVDGYDGGEYSIELQGVVRQRELRISASFTPNDVVRKAINDHFKSYDQKELLKQTNDDKTKQKLINDL